LIMFKFARALQSVPYGVVLAVCFLSCATFPAQAVSDQEAVAALDATQQGFHLVQNKIAPAVVTIASTTEVTTTDPAINTPFGQFSPQQRTETRHVSGSGVIIRAEGIVLTNSHVVANAKDVTVTLTGSDKKLPATVIQTDPHTDLAIVRITTPGTYPTAPLGDANGVQVGDWAIAFGTPYGLQSTMTVGVISATGRSLPDVNDYNDLLQTDAAINHGNSGGPLVNIHGDVIGINFMIYSPGEESGSIGLGFAIPINDYTKSVIETLIAGKNVEHGRLGVGIKNLDTDALRQEFGVPDGGVLVLNVMPGLPAEKAGMKEEDVITEFNGEKVTGLDQFMTLVQRTQPGTTVTLTVMRDKLPLQITLTLGEDTSLSASAAAAVNEQKVGMKVTTLTPELANRYDLTVKSGVLVTSILPGGAAEDAGLRPGDVIVRVEKTPVTSAEDFWSALSKEMATTKLGVILRIRSGDQHELITLPPMAPK
jgi:serine protease Do